MDKIPVGILGATGMVGQKFVQLLVAHPWFEIVALAASERSVNKRYGDVVRWSMPTPLFPKIADMRLIPCAANLPCQLVFSGLDSSVAGEIETDFAKNGYTVISNSSNHRMDPNVPLIIPEVNPEHLRLLKNKGGAIITNPNCSVIGISMALKPLLDQWGIESVHAVTLQALSGAGYPGVPSIDILDNVIPYIANEEDKLETEPLKIFGTYNDGELIHHPMQLSAQCTRVCVSDGHLACLSVKLKKKTQEDAIINGFREFTAEPQRLNLPSAPKQPILYFEENHYPQPKLHRTLNTGMSVSVGRLRKCPILDWKFVILSHNTVRGAAGCALLNAELMVQKGYLKGANLAPSLEFTSR